MRLPRVRFTVGKLVFAVVVIATNCGVLRLLSDRVETIVGNPPPADRALAGSLVALNVAEWGDCLFLTSANDHALRAFCRESLAAKCSPNYRKINGAHSRWQDSQKLPAGLPRVPWNVWVSFLLDEINCKNDEGILRLSIKSVGTRE